MWLCRLTSGMKSALPAAFSGVGPDLRSQWLVRTGWLRVTSDFEKIGYRPMSIHTFAQIFHAVHLPRDIYDLYLIVDGLLIWS